MYWLQILGEFAVIYSANVECEEVMMNYSYNKLYVFLKVNSNSKVQGCDTFLFLTDLN